MSTSIVPARTGIANLPLHYGKVPPWLFGRMVKLAREIVIAIVTDFGAGEKPHNVLAELKRLKTLDLPSHHYLTTRDLSLIAELVHGVAPSYYRDPARYSFAHESKDGIPYPVDRKTYDQSIELLRKALSKAKLGLTEKSEAMKRLTKLRLR
ncbi:unnamed protein product [marine sediment metagenome]|uniref:DUF763 domain-containing protein n=1 Tax=marine sediment metagenome TaxID=412755 RepID=X1EJG0_9ZZZZ